VIAYGRTLADPPHFLQKGDQSSRRFPMISVYDGRRGGVGRVAVDSTRQHWFDMNIAALQTAGEAAGAAPTIAVLAGRLVIFARTRRTVRAPRAKS